MTDLGTAYIVGRISGVPEGNRPLFERAQADLADQGWRAAIPMQVPEAQEAMREALSYGIKAVGRPAYRRVMKALLRLLLDVDRVYVLPGWEQSNGARIEVLVALTIGTPIYEWRGEDQLARPVTPELRVLTAPLDAVA